MTAAESSYLEMIAKKSPRPEMFGLSTTIPKLSSHLRGYQRATVEFGLAAGRWGCFLDTGLGKTLVEHEWGMHAAENSNGRTLILCPLAVAQQQRREGERFGYPIRVIREMDGVGEGLNVCNYDRVHLLDPDAFGAVILDESAILRSMTGKVSEDLRRRFAHHRWRLAAAAVPAPNDHTELGQTADFLGVMSAREMLMRWFTPDHSKTQAYRLLRHGEGAFWEWVAGWARAAGHPADLGFPEENFTVPEVRIVRHAVDGEVRISGSLPFASSVSATTMHDIKRQTSSARAAAMAEMIAQEPGEPWVVWVDTDYEADAALDALRRIDKGRALDVRGSMPAEKKEEALDRFSASGEPLVLVTKPEIAGLGLNWQHCARTWFMGRSFSYLNFYQAVRRFKRYGQQREVQVHLSIAEGEDVIGRSLDRKAEDHRRMMAHMVEATKKRASATSVAATLTPYRPASSAPAPAWLGGGNVDALNQRHGQRFALFNGDCVEVMRQLPDACLDLTVYSPPFAGLYIYSDSPADMGNCADDEEFLRQYRYAVEEKYRVTRPGRLSAVHCKDLRNLAGTTGRSGLRDFQGKIIEVHQSAGWEFHTRITLWRCPVKQQATSKGSRLNYKDLMRDATFSMMGTPEYLLIFRRWAETESEKAAVVPVIHRPESFPLPQWQEWASPVWSAADGAAGIDAATFLPYPVWGYPPTGDSLDETDVLGSDKDASDEKHICPLPMDITRRVVRMWSNPGDIVGSMFAGIGSEGVVALEEGRRSVGIELKASYFQQNGEWLDGIDRQMGLF